MPKTIYIPEDARHSGIGELQQLGVPIRQKTNLERLLK